MEERKKGKIFKHQTSSKKELDAIVEKIEEPIYDPVLSKIPSTNFFKYTLKGAIKRRMMNKIEELEQES